MGRDEASETMTDFSVESHTEGSGAYYEHQSQASSISRRLKKISTIFAKKNHTDQSPAKSKTQTKQDQKAARKAAKKAEKKAAKRAKRRSEKQRETELPPRPPEPKSMHKKRVEEEDVLDVSMLTEEEFFLRREDRGRDYYEEEQTGSYTEDDNYSAPGRLQDNEFDEEPERKIPVVLADVKKSMPIIRANEVPPTPVPAELLHYEEVIVSVPLEQGDASTQEEEKPAPEPSVQSKKKKKKRPVRDKDREPESFLKCCTVEELWKAIFFDEKIPQVPGACHDDTKWAPKCVEEEEESRAESIHTCDAYYKATVHPPEESSVQEEVLPIEPEPQVIEEPEPEPEPEPVVMPTVLGTLVVKPPRTQLKKEEPLEEYNKADDEASRRSLKLPLPDYLPTAGEFPEMLGDLIGDISNMARVPVSFTKGTPAAAEEGEAKPTEPPTEKPKEAPAEISLKTIEPALSEAASGSRGASGGTPVIELGPPMGAPSGETPAQKKSMPILPAKDNSVASKEIAVKKDAAAAALVSTPPASTAHVATVEIQHNIVSDLLPDATDSEMPSEYEEEGIVILGKQATFSALSAETESAASSVYASHMIQRIMVETVGVDTVEDSDQEASRASGARGSSKSSKGSKASKASGFNAALESTKLKACLVRPASEASQASGPAKSKDSRASAASASKASQAVGSTASKDAGSASAASSKRAASLGSRIAESVLSVPSTAMGSDSAVSGSRGSASSVVRGSAASAGSRGSASSVVRGSAASAGIGSSDSAVSGSRGYASSGVRGSIASASAGVGGSDSAVSGARESTTSDFRGSSASRTARSTASKKSSFKKSSLGVSLSGVGEAEVRQGRKVPKVEAPMRESLYSESRDQPGEESVASLLKAARAGLPILPDKKSWRNEKLSRKEAQKREMERMRLKKRHFRNLMKERGRDEIERARMFDQLSQCSDMSGQTSIGKDGEQYDFIDTGFAAKSSFDSAKSNQSLGTMIKDALKRADRTIDFVLDNRETTE